MPPTTVRGALASLALREVPADDERFQRAFMQGGIRTTSLLPVTNEGVEKKMDRVIPTPLTLMACKHHGRDHDEEDGLFATTHLAIIKQSPKAANGTSYLLAEKQAMEPLEECPKCRQLTRYSNVLKRVGGFVFHDHETYPSISQPGKRLQTHVGLDRERRGSSKGILYSRQVINESTTTKTVYLQGEVSGDKDLIEWFTKLLDRGNIVRIGNALSRGLGRCEVDVFQPAKKRKLLATRIKEFNDKFRLYTKLRDEQRIVVSLTLETPAFFVDAFLTPNLSPDALDLIQDFTEQEREQVEAVGRLTKLQQVVRTYQKTGWNQLAGFPRSTETGLQAGSVLVYETDMLDNSLMDALTYLEECGVGLHRRIRIRVSECVRFHPL